MTTPLTTMLPNGVRVVIDPMPGLLSAAIGVYFRAGTIDETREENGVAHLLEHMAFKGTRRRSARDIAEEIEAVGGYLNASTGYTRTGYYARILSGDAGVAFDILGDIVTEPLFDPGELEKEREVVIQEIGEAADQPDDVVMELLQTLSFGDHPLGRPILGTEESVTAQQPGSLRAFMASRYSPENLIVAASGGVDPDAIAALVSERFASRQASGAAPARQAPRYVGGRAHDNRDIEQTHIALAFPGAAVTDADYFATRLFVEALGGGMSSRIFQSVREDRGLAYSVYSFLDAYEDIGTVGVYVGTEAANAAEAVALIRRDIEALAASPTAKEIDRARAMLKSTLLMGLESPATRSEAAVSQLFAHGRLVPPAELSDRLDAVTIEDVRAVAAKALSGTASSLSVVGPAKFDSLVKALDGGGI